MFYMVVIGCHSVLSSIIGVCCFVRDHGHNTFILGNLLENTELNLVDLYFSNAWSIDQISIIITCILNIKSIVINLIKT